MSKVSKNKKAQNILTLHRSFNSSERKKWQKAHQECYDFYLNDQLTKEQKKDLQEAGMPDFVINMVIPAVELMKYFLTANNPRWQAVGRDGSDVDIAAVFAGIGQYVWHISSGKALLGQNIVNAVVKSKMYWHVIIDPDDDMGQGEVKIQSVDPFDVWESPDTSDIYGRDAGAKMIYKIKSRDELLSLLPQYSAQIKKANGIGSYNYVSERDYDDSPTIQPEDIIQNYNTTDGALSDRLEYIEKYRKVKLPFVRVVTAIPPSMQEVREVNEYIDVELKELAQELDVQLKELELQLTDAVKSGDMIPERMELELKNAQENAKNTLMQREQLLLSKARDEATKVEIHNISKKEYEAVKDDKIFNEFVVSVTDYYETRIERSCSVGDQLLYEYLLPEYITEYPLFSIPAIFTGTPFPISFIIPAIGKQKEINKAHQITIHNANLGSNLRVLYEEGQIDEDLWDKYMSSAGAKLPWHNLGDGQKPEFILPAQLNTAFYTLVEKGQQDFEYLVGMMGSAMGLIQEQAETYRGMLANDEYSTRRLRGWMINIFEPGMELLGKIVSQFAQSLYSSHKVFRIVQPNAETGEIQTISEEVNIPLYNDLGEQAGRFKDLQSARYDIVYVAGSTLPVNRWALLEEYFKWFQAGLIDDIEFLQYTDIQGKEDLVKRNSLYAKLKQQIQQMEEAIKNKDGDIETLSRQILQLSIKAEKLGLTNQMEKDVLETESKQRDLQNKFKNEIDLQKGKIKLEAEKIKNEIKTKSQKKVDNKKK